MIIANEEGKNVDSELLPGAGEHIGRWTGIVGGYLGAGCLGWSAAKALITGTSLLSAGAFSLSPVVAVLCVSAALATIAVACSRLTNDEGNLVPSEGSPSWKATMLTAGPATSALVAGAFSLWGMAKTSGINPAAFAAFAKLATGCVGVLALATVPFSCAIIGGRIGHYFDSNRASRPLIRDLRTHVSP